MPREKEWTIRISAPLQGFTPGWFRDNFSRYGNKQMAGDLQNIDITNPNVITQGLGIAALTNGTDAAAVTTLIKGILHIPTSDNKAFAIGLNKLYEFTASAVTNTGNFPHTIDKAAVTDENGEDVVHYQGALYYSYNHNGGGDIGKYDLVSTFDDDFWTASAGAATLQVAPHQMIEGGDDRLYFANGRYVGAYDGTTASSTQFDFPQNGEVASISWDIDRIYVAYNRPNLSGNNQNKSSIYAQNPTRSSWDYEIVVKGKIGALYTKNGATFVWWQDITDSTGGFNFGVINGRAVTRIASFKGSLPLYYQVGEYKNHLAWVSDGFVYIYGSADEGVPSALSQVMRATYPYDNSVGGFATTFGTPLIASSDDSASYAFAVASGYETSAFFKTLAFNVGDGWNNSQIDRVVVLTEQLGSGAACSGTLEYDDGVTTVAMDNISDTSLTRHIVYKNGVEIEDFRLNFNFSVGSSTNPVKIKEIIIHGHYKANH